MSDIQHDTYADADRIKSDPFGILSRDNRNHRKKQQVTLEYTHAERGDRVLEVGCGHGLHARKYDWQFNYTGVDLSPQLVDETKARTGPSACVFEGDATDLPMGDDYFQAVVGNAILHHIGTPTDALKEWCRVVRPGGSVTLTEPNYLFPKDFLETHTLPEERHKRNMAPWRMQRILDDLPYPATVEPIIYTLPWPAALHGVYDRLDDILSHIPALRWAAQMLLIHVEVE